MNVKPEFGEIQLNSFVPYQITLLADLTARQTASVAKRHDGLNLSHWRVLAAVAEAPGRTANDVVAVTPMDKGIVSRAVKSLIGMKLISRKASNEDGRIGHLFLTARGMRQYQSMAREIRQTEELMQSSLSAAQWEAFSRTLSVLIAAMKERAEK